MLKPLPSCLLLISLCVFPGRGQTTPGAKALEHVIGTVTAVDPAAHTITIKEDKTGTSDVISLQDTKTLLKVAPGAKDLKSATRITGDDLAVGDRVDVRGTKSEDPNGSFAARSVVLMSARELQQAHQAEAAEWQHSTAGIVAAVDPAGSKITINARTAEGMKPLIITVSPSTQLTRYSPESPKTPVPAQLSQIQTGDQVRVLGDKSADGTAITATKLYSGAFRVINGTITSISPDGKQLTVKNLATNKPTEIDLNDESTVRKLPQEVAMGLARHLNPSARGNQGASSGRPQGASDSPGASGQGPAAQAERPHTEGGAPEGGSPDQSKWQGGQAGQGGARGMRGAGNGDVSQLLERLPKVSITDLKPGDALVISGVATGSDNSRLLATNVIAGVEPILQSAPRRGGGQTTMGGDWGLGEMSIPQ